MNYELSNILFVFPYFIEISKNTILISRCCYRKSCVLSHYATATKYMQMCTKHYSSIPKFQSEMIEFFTYYQWYRHWTVTSIPLKPVGGIWSIFLQIKYITCFKMFMRQYSSVLRFFRGDHLMLTFLSTTSLKLVGWIWSNWHSM